MVDDRAHPFDPQGRPLCSPLFQEAVDGSNQRDHAVMNRHANVLGVDLRVPIELVQDVLMDLLVGPYPYHCSSLPSAVPGLTVPPGSGSA